MSHKRLYFEQAAREKVLRGATALADAVRVTLGPKSKCVLIERKYGKPLVCNDGVTIAKEIDLEDAEENLGAQTLREAAERTGEAVGDGTTTATLLALRPLVSASLIAPGADIVVDAKSGVSGAGKTPSERTHFSEVHGSVSAYGVFGHRHGAEIEQGVGGQVNFVPHLMPLDRGILSTIYVRVTPGTTEASLASVYERTYGGEPFVRLVGASLPEIKHVAHTNFCDIGWRVDPSGRAVLVSVIDNLLKGASGQAVQNMNVMLGFDQTTGLW